MRSRRLEAALDSAQARGLDALALLPGPDLLYMTGWDFHLSERPIVAIFPVDEAPAIILPAFEAGKVHDADIYPYTDEEGYVPAFHAACSALELADARVGVAALHMRLFEARLLKRYAPGIELLAVDELWAELRMRKDAEEVAAMRRAVQVAEQAFLDWLPQLRVGMSEREAAARLIASLLTHGADKLAFDPIIAAGPNGALPHAIPGERPLALGDWVVVDWGAIVGGYVSDLTRTVVIGTPSGPLMAVWDAVTRANAAGRAAVRPGVRAEAVDAATRAVIEAAGYGAAFTHRTGHGIGLAVHEAPYIMAGNAQLLGAGMTFTVEPGVYLEGVGGVRIEDDVLVTAQGSETLSTLPREPFVVAG